ncbi:MAG: hypothetical protein Q9174_002125 [Haloplaca sp. 1 TL-2023]
MASTFKTHLTPENLAAASGESTRAAIETTNDNQGSTSSASTIGKSPQIQKQPLQSIFEVQTSRPAQLYPDASRKSSEIVPAVPGRSIPAHTGFNTMATDHANDQALETAQNKAEVVLDKIFHQCKLAALRKYKNLSEQDFQEEFVRCETHWRTAYYLKRRLNSHSAGNPIRRWYQMQLDHETDQLDVAIAAIQFDGDADDYEKKRKLSPLVEHLLEKYVKFAG